MEKDIIFSKTFLDFDKTLFDCEKFEADIFAILQNFSVDWDDFVETYLRSLHTQQKNKYDYNFEEHVDFLREKEYKIPDSVLLDLHALLKNDYLYSDTLDFLKFIKQNTKKLFLLSVGDYAFQREKINNSGIIDYFDELFIIESDKHKFLQDNFSDLSQTLFINDNLQENSLVKEYNNQVNVVTRFNNKKYNEAQVKEMNIPYFKTLREIKNYVEQL